jgi:hypothetical protein
MNTLVSVADIPHNSRVGHTNSAISLTGRLRTRNNTSLYYRFKKNGKIFQTIFRFQQIAFSSRQHCRSSPGFASFSRSGKAVWPTRASRAPPASSPARTSESPLPRARQTDIPIPSGLTLFNFQVSSATSSVPVTSVKLNIFNYFEGRTVEVLGSLIQLLALK